MGTLRRGERRSLQEAAAWFTRLRQDAVSEATIDEFFAWRRTPANEAAYAKVEERMRRADRLRNDPELVRMTEEVLRRPSRAAQISVFFKRSAPIALAGAALAAIAVVVVIATRPPTYSTEIGAQQVVRLEDGSIVRLNTDSKVQVRYGKDVRRLVLERGEAFFEVARDERRPFVVEAGEAEIRALGTKFDVRRRAEQTEVTLVEGKVEVAREGRPQAWTLRPHQQIIVNGSEPAPRSVDVAEATSWTTGRLRFSNTPLVSAVEEVNRYSRTKIVLAAGDVASVEVNGAFEAGDTAAFVSAVTELFDLAAEKTPEGVVLRSRASNGKG